MRLPSLVHLPFGYTVRIKLVTDTEMNRLMGGEGKPDGLWDDEARAIYIRKSLPTRRQRYILWHELAHAVTDGEHQSLNDETAKP